MDLKIELGTTADRGGAFFPAIVDLEKLLSTRLLVQGNSGSGKSYLLRRLLEQSAGMVQQVIIDPEGDFISLSEVYGHVVIDANRPETELQTIAERVREHRVSAILDLSSLEVAMQMKAAGIFLNSLFDAPREHWYPVLVTVDEAQLFAPAVAGDVDEAARKVSLGAMTNLMCRGRKRGLAGVIATQRLAKLAKNVAAEASNFLMGRTFLDIDMVRAADLLGVDKSKTEMFRDLETGNFIGLGPAIARRPVSIKIGEVRTAALGSSPAYQPLPEMSAEGSNDLILAPVSTSVRRAPGGRRPAPSSTPTSAVLADVRAHAVTDSEESLIGARGEAGALLDPESETVAERERREAWLDIVNQIMAEEGAPFATEAVLFQSFGVHCRIRRVPSLKLEQFREYLILGRAGVDRGVVSHQDWGRVMEVARQIPEDARGVYLFLAVAAMRKAPCPSDEDIARVCGSISRGRGRARLAALEQGTFVTIRSDMRKMRTVLLPDLGWETSSGDPNGSSRLIAS